MSKRMRTRRKSAMSGLSKLVPPVPSPPDKTRDVPSSAFYPQGTAPPGLSNVPLSRHLCKRRRRARGCSRTTCTICSPVCGALRAVSDGTCPSTQPIDLGESRRCGSRPRRCRRIRPGEPDPARARCRLRPNMRPSHPPVDHSCDSGPRSLRRSRFRLAMQGVLRRRRRVPNTRRARRSTPRTCGSNQPRCGAMGLAGRRDVRRFVPSR